MMATMERPAYMLPAVGSFGIHLLFGVLIGGFWLAQESPPDPKPVEFKIIDKKPPPEKEEIKKKILEPQKVEIPVVEPVKLNEPVAPQQVVQQVPQVTQQEVVPLKMDQLPTVSNAPQVSMVRPRSMVAPSKTTQAVRAIPLMTSSNATGAVSVRKPRVRAMTVPKLTPQPMAKVTQSTGSGKVSIRKGARSVITNNQAAPVAMAPITPAPVAKKAPKKVAPPPAPPAPPAPVVSAPQASTDIGVLNGYKRRIGVRVQKVGQRSYKRSSLRRTNRSGRVLLQFTVLRSGDIKNVSVAKGSPFERLDELAMDSLKKSAPFAEFPDDIVENELTFIIPIVFTLR